MTNRRPCTGILPGLALSLVMACIPAALMADTAAFMAKGDRAWSQRANGHQGPRAVPEPIEAAIEAYLGVLSSDPEILEARWYLLRAFYF